MAPPCVKSPRRRDKTAASPSSDALGFLAGPLPSLSQTGALSSLSWFLVPETSAQTTAAHSVQFIEARWHGDRVLYLEARQTRGRGILSENGRPAPYPAAHLRWEQR